MPYELPFTQPDVPGIYLRISNALAAGSPTVPHRVVVVGTRLSTGSVDELVPKQVYSGVQAEAFWGQGSMVAEMAKAALAQGKVELFGVGVDELLAGVVATGALNISGTATESGSLAFFVGGTRVRVPVIKDQAAATIITNTIAAANDIPTLPATASDGTTKVDFTAKWKGASGNDIDLRLDSAATQPAGLTLSVTAMASGASDPEIDDALAALGDDAKYDTVIVGYNDTINIGHLDAWLEPRWGETVALDGQGFVASVASFADLTTLASNVDTKFVTVVAGGDSPTPPWIIAAQAGAADALVTQRQPNEPRLDIVLRSCKAPDTEDRFSLDERDTLLKNGISTTIGSPNGSLKLEKLLTTYTQDGNGFPDESYAGIHVMRTLSRLRYDLQVWRSKYPDWLISEDETQSELPKVMTPKRLRGFLTAVYKGWVDSKFCQDITFFQQNLVIAIDANKTDYIVFVPVKLVYPLNAIAGELAFV